MSLLESKQLTVRIGGIQVCQALDLHIDPGQCWGLLGRNGAGKTTLLHTLAGLRAPEYGELLLDGAGLQQLSRRQIARRLGLLLQDSEDLFPATVLETALAGRHPHLGRWGWEGADDIRRTKNVLTAVGLGEMAQRQVTTLSGGERRRLAIATLLIQEPALALLDEPTNHLDLHQQIAMLELLCGHLRDGDRAMLLILHDINLALRFCDHLLLLFGHGETIQGPAREVACVENLEQLYACSVVEIPGPSGPLYMPGE